MQGPELRWSKYHTEAWKCGCVQLSGQAGIRWALTASPCPHLLPTRAEHLNQRRNVQALFHAVVCSLCPDLPNSYSLSQKGSVMTHSCGVIGFRSPVQALCHPKGQVIFQGVRPTDVPTQPWPPHHNSAAMLCCIADIHLIVRKVGQLATIESSA